MGFDASEFWPPATTYNAERDVPDLTGKVALVTGGSGGLGKETVRVLMLKGAKVYLAARSEEKSAIVINELGAKGYPGEVLFHHLDLGGVKKVRASAEAFLKREQKLHILVNNAGVSPGREGNKWRTDDGLDYTWGTNVVGTFAFTEALLPLLRKTAKISAANTVRIVSVSSAAHHLAPPPDGVHLEDVSLKGMEGSGNFTIYCQSKLATIIIANQWAEKLRQDGVMSLSLHPGAIVTDLNRGENWLVRTIWSWLFYPPSMGAWTQLYCATDRSLTVAEHSGSYWNPWARLSAPKRPEATDAGFIKKVIELLERQVEEALAN